MSHTDDGIEEIPIDEEEGEENDEEEEEEEAEEEEDEDVLTIYDSDTFISNPILSEKSTLPGDILEFHFSFGYDCRKYFNLTVPDPNTVVFISGNFINIYDIEERAITFRRSALGKGIAHIKANPCPEFNHLAIAEHGQPSLIIIYEWPDMEINCVLKGGSLTTYSHIDYSSDGLLLVSQGGEPDYLITIWNWPKRRILLRTKSYVNDVYRVKFSPDVPGQLTSCGVSHIKFWKMANTFTGLKLKGEIGRFGKTEFTDILGVLPMPDEKVVSGCSWGNILVWDASMIKLEVFRTLRRKCHDGPIVQLYYNEGELTTVSMDGHVKVWWYEKIDQADPPDEDRIIQIEPTYDFYTPGLMLMALRKRYPDPTDHTYLGQDGNGGIWILDLNPDVTPRAAQQVYKCHAGKVVDLAACPWGPYLVSLGEDGRIYVYAYLEKKFLFEHQFPAKARVFIWLDPKLTKYGDEILVAFDDGSIRLCILDLTEPSDVKLHLIRTIKPHHKPITAMSINKSNTVLVTGAEDSTVFIMKIVQDEEMTGLFPIGYVKVPNPVTCFTWHHTDDEVLLVGCLRGEIMQMTVLREPQDYTTVSYELITVEKLENVFKTYKAQIRRDIRIAEIQAQKADKVEKKRVEMEKLKKENPGLEIDEEVFLADSESEEELEPLHIPEIPNRIIWMQSTQEDTIWLSMGGYDAGYIYEYKIDQKEEAPFQFQMVYNGDDIEISSYVYNYNKKYLVFAMQDGSIRLNKLHDDDFHDLSDYWKFSMHDNLNGFVPKMCFSYDERYFFSCGYDGNVFSYIFHPEYEDYVQDYAQIPEIRTEIPEPKEDEEYYTKLSIEQASLKKEQDRIDALANRNKEILRGKLKILYDRFQKVLMRNAKLPHSQVIKKDELELDPRVTEFLDGKLQAKLDLVQRKLAFDVQKSEVRMKKLKEYFVDNLSHIPFLVKGFNIRLSVKIKRQRKIQARNEEMLDIIIDKMIEEQYKSKAIERQPPMPRPYAPAKKRDKQLEYFLVSLSPDVIERGLGPKLSRLLQKYRDRKLKWERREEQWQAFLARKPEPGVNQPEDEVAYAEAQETIGDFHLKTGADYKASREQKPTTLKKYRQLLLSRQKQFDIRNEYNTRVTDLRDGKLKLVQELRELQEKLLGIHEEIAPDLRKRGPRIEEVDMDQLFPEKAYEINATLEIPDEEPPPEPIPLVEPLSDYDSCEKFILPLYPMKKKRKIDQKQTLMDVSISEYKVLIAIAENETEDTPWEQEIRAKRYQRKLYEQERTIERMHKKIRIFNEDLHEIFNTSHRTEVNGKLMDIFLCSLHQELIILKSFESLEFDLQDKVNIRTAEVFDMRDIINSMNDEIVTHQKEIAKFNDEILLIYKNFIQTVEDNKFFEFLKKVYKKKYKPPRVHRDDESSSESSSSETSSSESEDDAKSIDSRDFAIIKQDINVCPKGCDPGVYEYTVNARTKRHQVEIRIKEELKAIDGVKKDLEMQHKKVKVIEKMLTMSQEELEKYQKEKQRKLNEVRGTVVLKMHQMQHLISEEATAEIGEVLVFSQQCLSELYARVEQLYDETQMQIKKYKNNVKHLTRMNTDCEYMAKQIKSLQQTISDNMLQKFGKIVDINEIEEAMIKRTFGQDNLRDLEEVLLKKLVHDLKLDLLDLKGLYIPELERWTNIITNTQKELAATLRNNTYRQELLTMLTKEKLDLAEYVRHQDKKRAHIEAIQKRSMHYSDEIRKLELIRLDQDDQIRELKLEIKLLKTKGMIHKPTRDGREHLLRKWDLSELIERELDEEEEEHEAFSADLTIPRTLSQEAQQVAQVLLKELLESLEIALDTRSTENFIKGTLEKVMRGLSVADIIDDIIDKLPVFIDDDQRGKIETTAEMLYTIDMREPTESEIRKFAEELLEEVVEETLMLHLDPDEMVAKLIMELVDRLPVDYLSEQSSIEFIVKKLLLHSFDVKLNRKEMMDRLNRFEARKILDQILQTVYDTGVDLIYYIKD